MNIMEELGSKNGLTKSKYLGKVLAESQLYKPFVEDIQDDWKRACCAIMLENTREYIAGLSETTRAIQIGDFEKYAFPLVRAIFPELIAHDIVSTQPMAGPTSLVFYLRLLYGSTKGTVSQGQTTFDPVGLGPNNPNYTSPTIDSEVVASGSNVQATVYTGNLSYTPVQPGSVVLTDGTQVITDDGNGNLIGNIGSAGTPGNTINYATGAFSVEFVNAVTTSVPITASYDYNMEAQPNLPEIDLDLTSTPVVARPRKLRAKWSLEAAFNLRSLHGLDAEVELTSAIGAEVRFETDREIINDLRNIAPSSELAAAWSLTKRWVSTDPFSTASGATDIVSLNEHNLSINNQIVQGSNNIFAATGRAIGTWMLIGISVADIIETLPNYTALSVPNGLLKGPYLAGRLGSRPIYKDPFYQTSEWLMGYRGTSMLDTGYVYAPYIPLYTTPTIVLDDFISRKAMASQYGKKVVNPMFYTRGMLVA
jgi:hypothetical protein